MSTSPASDALSVVAPGDVIAGAYRIEALVGEGAMGSVYAAVQVNNGDRVAIKVLHPRHLMRSEYFDRFVREARVAAQLESRHAVRVHDVGTLPGDVPFFVMEYLHGVDLQALVQQNGPLPVGRAAAYVVQACEAVGEAHRVGVIHRDIKPANLFLTRGAEGQELVKVIDFGVSKLLRPIEGDGDVTATTVVVGTPAYMAPEQMRSSKVDARADIWSLAVTLFWLLTGRRPFEGDTIVKIYEGILRGCPNITELRPEVPKAIEDQLRQCLAWDPEARLASVAEFSEALQPYATRGMLPSLHLTQAMEKTQVMAGAPVETAITAVSSEDEGPTAVRYPIDRAALEEEIRERESSARTGPFGLPRWSLLIAAVALLGGGYLLGTANRGETTGQTPPEAEPLGTPTPGTPAPETPAPAEPPGEMPGADEPSEPAEPAEPAVVAPDPPPSEPAEPVAPSPAPVAAKPAPPVPPRPLPPRPEPKPKGEDAVPLHPPASGKADDVWGMP